MKASEIDWSKAPEGAMYYLPESDSSFPVWVKKGDDGQWMAWLADGDTRWDEDDSLDEVEHFLLQRPTEWNGTGLPPVGAVCEGRGRLDGGWREVVVLAHRIGRAVVSFTDHERLQWCEADELRPIRAPEQIAAEERERACDVIYGILRKAERPGNLSDMAEAIYDAGYRKVEGDKQ